MAWVFRSTTLDTTAGAVRGRRRKLLEFFFTTAVVGLTMAPMEGPPSKTAWVSGTVMPKWSKGLRPGRTYMDIYKLFSKEELKQMPL